MNARLLRTAFLAGLCATVPLRAGAVPYHVVYEATITDGSDMDGIFGVQGRNLAGLSMRADVTYLTSVAGTRTTSAFDDEVTGGDAFGTDPVISSAVFTIGTRSFAFTPSYYGDVYASADFLDAYGYDTLGNSFETYMLPTLAGPTNLQTPFSGTGTGDSGGRTTQYSYLITGDDIIDFDATRVTVPAVPEAAAWAMMLVGFGAVGCALRRRDEGRTAALV